MFSDSDIYAAISDDHLRIDPFNPRLVQPASVDLTLGGEYLTLHTHSLPHIDPAVDQTDQLYGHHEAIDGVFYVHPGSFIIGTTIERISLSNKIVGRLEGKSSLGRLGLLIHSTAGFFDPGFDGQATLEIANVSGTAIRLYVGMPIAQMAFDRLDTPGSAYQGKYLGQEGPRPSAYWKNFAPGGVCENLMGMREHQPPNTNDAHPASAGGSA